MNLDNNVPFAGPGGISSPRRKALDKLAAASQYARLQLADPTMRAEYENRHTTTKKNAYALAVADYLNPPQIRSVNLRHYTGHAGEPIAIKATDDFRVAGVRVELLDSQGAPIEGGEAREQGNTTWRYKTRQTIAPCEHICLVITAYDFPGNTSKQIIHLRTGSESANTNDKIIALAADQHQALDPDHHPTPHPT